MAKITTVTAGDIAVLPLQPTIPVAESLEWLSDFMQSLNGSEEILQLRAAPRQSFQFTYPETATQKEMGLNVQYAAISKVWGVPLWTEAQYIGAISNGSATITCEVDVFDFRDASLVFIWQDDSHFQVLDIGTVGSGVLNLHSGQTTNLYTGAWVMPMRVGHVTSQIQRKSNGFNVATTIGFQIDDNVPLDAGDDPTQFLSNDLYFDNPLVDGDGVTFAVNTRIDTIDYTLGPIAYRAPWTNNRIDYSRSVLCSTPQEVRTFKQWLARRAGKSRKFWEPSFENDLRKQSTGNVTTTFLVARDSLTDWTALPRNHVAFELDDGSWLARTITSITTISGTQVQLNLSSTLAVPASRIHRVSWLGLKRLDTDRVELTWNGGGVMQANMQVTEVQP